MSNRKNMKRRIQLNVGGHIYSTTISTLIIDGESYFAKMFGGNWELNREDDGTIFIDRDGTHFRHILNFLRDGKLNLTTASEEVLEELKTEAEFYILGGLVSSIERQQKIKDQESFRFLISVDRFSLIAMGSRTYFFYCYPNQRDRVFVGAASGVWDIGEKRCRVRGVLTTDIHGKMKIQLVAAASFGAKGEKISENDAKLKVVVTAVSQEEDGREWKLGEADVETWGLSVRYGKEEWSEPQELLSVSCDEVTKKRPWLVYNDSLFLRFDITVVCDVQKLL